MWIKRDDGWHFAEFTKGGILKAGPSPYLTDTGESDCELFFQSAYVNRENKRYGYVREMISPQDEINKRRRKTLHVLNSKQIVMANGAVDGCREGSRRGRTAGWRHLVNPPISAESRQLQFPIRLDDGQGNSSCWSRPRTPSISRARTPPCSATRRRAPPLHRARPSSPASKAA